jgi:hypothetical protein
MVRRNIPNRSRDSRGLDGQDRPCVLPPKSRPLKRLLQALSFCAPGRMAEGGSAIRPRGEPAGSGPAPTCFLTGVVRVGSRPRLSGSSECALCEIEPACWHAGRPTGLQAHRSTPPDL